MEQEDWSGSLTRRVGKAVRLLRDESGQSAQWLSDRTAELGYRVSRARIADIEGKNRGGEIKVAELVVLARACEIPPIMLLYPDLPEGPVQYTPDETVSTWTAIEYFTGTTPYKVGEHVTPESNRNVKTLETLRHYYDAVNELDFIRHQMVQVMMMAADAGEPDSYDRAQDPQRWAEATRAQRAVETAESALKTAENSIVAWRQRIREAGLQPPAATDHLEATEDLDAAKPAARSTIAYRRPTRTE